MVSDGLPVSSWIPTVETDSIGSGVLRHNVSVLTVNVEPGVYDLLREVADSHLDPFLLH